MSTVNINKLNAGSTATVTPIKPVISIPTETGNNQTPEPLTNYTGSHHTYFSQLPASSFTFGNSVGNVSGFPITSSNPILFEGPITPKKKEFRVTIEEEMPDMKQNEELDSDHDNEDTLHVNSMSKNISLPIRIPYGSGRYNLEYENSCTLNTVTPVTMNVNHTSHASLMPSSTIIELSQNNTVLNTQNTGEFEMISYNDGCRENTAYSATQSTFTSYVIPQETVKAEINKCVDILAKLPWFQLPFALSQTKYNDKFFQAFHIFNKYLAMSAYDAINISAHASNTIEAKFQRLLDYKLKCMGIKTDVDSIGSGKLVVEVGEKVGDEKKMMDDTGLAARHSSEIDDECKNGNITDDENGMESNEVLLDAFAYFEDENGYFRGLQRKSKLASQLGLEIYFQGDHERIYECMKKLPVIENDIQFAEMLDSVFDCALPDVLRNLEESYMRFKGGDEYFLIIADLL